MTYKFHLVNTHNSNLPEFGYAEMNSPRREVVSSYVDLELTVGD